ncbi:alpha/beta fold hydrolase [Lyngbya confervoides]|uniref:Alpha/beta hydrolase n=1 Tax=Lyngbya confervoides BDU141951 TaxID=1574623 RepID=A0ABD4T0Y0_9CYAN|nr:alpha/beta hydrolase [Lyngbya confervoides]MCM1982314.1 alpha/beta hydrolase [Lyngbya confervoides BDU141951]
MSYTQVRGVKHYYEWITSAPSPSGTPKEIMVFLHGWGGSARYWESVAHRLSERFDCLLYDLRGFGRSQASPDVSRQAVKQIYDLETYALDLAAFLESLGLEKIHLQAHSTGSSIAALFMNRYPEQVERAILACNGIFEFEAKAFEQFHRFGELVIKFRPKWMLAIPGLEHLFMARFLDQSIPRPLKVQFLADFVDADQQAALGTMLTAVSQQSAQAMPAEFARIHCPTLLISGQSDRIIPAQMGARAADLNEHIVHRIIPNTGHFPMLEAPEAYLQEVQEFLALA